MVVPRGRTAPARSSRNSRNFTEVLTTIGTSGDGRSRPYRAVVPRWQVGYTSTRHGTSGVTRPRSYRAVVPCPRRLHRQQEARFEHQIRFYFVSSTSKPPKTSQRSSPLIVFDPDPCTPTFIGMFLLRSPTFLPLIRVLFFGILNLDLGLSLSDFFDEQVFVILF